MSLVGGTADPGGPGGPRGESGGKVGSCKKTGVGQGSVHCHHQFGTCERCDLSVSPHSESGCECNQSGKGAGCPCVSDSGGARLDRRLRKNRKQRSY